MKQVEIRDGYITLSQLLKKLDYISSGGEAKHFLSESSVIVNGEPEQRRGKKLVAGDQVTILGNTFVLVEA